MYLIMVLLYKSIIIVRKNFFFQIFLFSSF